jgi:hypothetical protein
VHDRSRHAVLGEDRDDRLARAELREELLELVVLGERSSGRPFVSA